MQHLRVCGWLLLVYTVAALRQLSAAVEALLLIVRLFESLALELHEAVRVAGVGRV
jgi:hypothetical protein